MPGKLGYRPQGPYALLVAGAPRKTGFATLSLLAETASFLMAVDSGADLAYALRLAPDAVIGDLDSISPEALQWCHDAAVPIYAASPHKDKTDLELALGHLEQRRCAASVVATNILGGRTDHELAALGALSRHPQLAPAIVEDDALMFFLHSSWRQALDIGEIVETGAVVSVIALNGDALVTISGMEWNMESGLIGPLDGHGVSNVVTGSAARVRVERGSVVVCVPGAD
jgi:thiamine pyrophosphokinase